MTIEERRKQTEQKLAEAQVLYQRAQAALNQAATRVVELNAQLQLLKELDG